MASMGDATNVAELSTDWTYSLDGDTIRKGDYMSDFFWPSYGNDR